MNDTKVPDWVNPQQFVNVVKQLYDYKSILSFTVAPAISGGENYLTTVLSIEIGITLQDDSCRSVKFILKIPLEHDKGTQHAFHALFVSEENMYKQIIPELEKLFVDYAGMRIIFKPRVFTFSTPPNCDYLLMEDLREQGFRNLDRMVGLKQAAIETVLKKLAQWHAASVRRIGIYGMYDETLRKSYFVENSRQMLVDMNAAFAAPFLECMHQYELNTDNQTTLRNYINNLTDKYIEFGHVDDGEFNVLNHGDFWCNNFMFRTLKDCADDDVCFVDFQLPKYGTPAQDLFCLLMTSSEFAIRLSHFDHFIDIYHTQLLASLKALKSECKLPTLTELHENLKRHGLWAFVCAQRMLPVAIFESSTESNVTNFMSDNESGMAFKRKLFSNSNYIKKIKSILPWLIKRQFIS